MSLYEYWYPLGSITECYAYFIRTGFLWNQMDQAKSWWIDLVFSDKGTQACKKATFLALQEKGCVQITKLTGSLLSNLKGISCSSLWAHHLWWWLTLWMRMKAYSTLHGTTIGLFLSCFITQKKSITNQPSSSRKNQHLISLHILHRLIRTKRLQEWNMGNDQYGEKWHTFFKKFHHQYSGMQPYDHSIDTITSLLRPKKFFSQAQTRV